MAHKAIKRTTSALLSVLIAACGGGGSDGSPGSSSQSTTTAGASQGTTSTGTNAGSSNTSSGTTSSGNAGSNSGSAPNTGTSPPASPTTPSPGTASFAVDATARFNMPSDITTDSAGNLYVCDIGNQAIRRIAVSGAVTTIPGSFGISPGNSRESCKLGGVNAAGNLILLSGVDVFEVNQAGARTSLASYTEKPGSYTPLDIALDPTASRLHVFLQYRNRFRVDHIDYNNNPKLVYSYLLNGYGLGIAFNAQSTMALGIRGAYDDPGRIVLVPRDIQPAIEEFEVVKPGASAVPVALREVGNMAFDQSGNLYISDYYVKASETNYETGQVIARTYSGMRIIKIAPDGNITTILDGLPSGSTTDQVVKTAHPIAMGIVPRGDGNLFVTDPFNHAIYLVNQSGQATLVTGKPGEAGFIN
jgi:hypothetical protein